jgi:hypothetical protein
MYVPGYSVYTLDSSGYAVPVPAYPLDPNATALVPQQQPDPQIEQTGPGVYVLGPAVQNGYQPQPQDQSLDQNQVQQQQPASKPITLLAFKDHSIYAVTDYWKEGGRIYYVTSYGGTNNVPIDQVDQDFTKRLNAERGVAFELKSADQN